MMEEEIVIDSRHRHQSIEEIDEARKKSVAYEYLCHLEEAKKWLEAVLHEQLPPTMELEEWLRNGVCLAKLGHFIAPDVVPLSKIYDGELKRYKRMGLQFAHTDNINYWLKSLVAMGLPKIFHPETTDVYDKKGMPKVIYCIHALSTHLFKLGKAPQIVDLYGTVTFTDAEIQDMNEVLENYGKPMPVFQKIGGLLTIDVSNDADTFHNAIVEINEALNQKDTKYLLQGLRNPITKIHDIEPSYIQNYWNTLNLAKKMKLRNALNHSASESFTSDVYDELLTHAEIQGHVTSVNVACVRDGIINAAANGQSELVLKLLSRPCLRLKSIFPQNLLLYVSEILNVEEKISGSGTIAACTELQKAVNKGNRRAEHQVMVAKQMEKIEMCLNSGTPEDLLKLLEDDVLELPVDRSAATLYFEELKVDFQETGKLLLKKDLTAALNTLNHITAVTKAVDAGDFNQTWNSLSNPSAHFSDLNNHLKIQYWQALTEARQLKLTKNDQNPVLTYCDIQIVIDTVNGNNEIKNKVIQILNCLNNAVALEDEETVINILQNPLLQLYDNVSPNDSKIYCVMFQECLQSKKGEGCLWLEDIKTVVQDVIAEVKESQQECVSLSRINLALKQDDDEFLMQSLKDSGFIVNGDHKSSIFAILKVHFDDKTNSECPWIVHHTKRNNVVFLNLEDLSYSWTRPENFHEHSYYLSRNEIKMILTDHAVKNSQHVYENLIIKLQSLIRGYLVRKWLQKRQEEKCAIKIQAWWRGIVQRRNFCEMLKKYRHFRKSLQMEDSLRHYRRQEGKIIKIQALWRGYQARKAFVALFHETKPSFKVVRQFIPYLNINNDDYTKEILLQNLKAKVTQAIRRNQQLAKQLDTMDIKIGLLVQNRISLQDVVAHSKNLNDLTLSASGETLGLKGLKSLNKESRKRLEGYQHLFYMLQTTPTYLAKLLFCLPKDRTVKFIKTVIWSLFNFGSNLREEYLLLKLFESALQEEVQQKFSEPSAIITSTPLVLQMVADYARQAVGPHSLQNTLQPLVLKVLGDKTLLISTNPVDIYKNWRCQKETKLGVVSQLPQSVSPEQALSYPVVQQRLADSITALKAFTSFFLDNIIQSVKLIPYGLLYIAKVLRDALEEKFPSVPEKDILKVVGNLIYYQYINPAIIGPDSYGIITMTADSSLSNAQRLNLASIAKILQFSAVKKGFGEESRHLMCLNSFIIDCHKKFKTFFRECCDVEDLDSHFSLHQYSEATLISRPVIYITLQEICDIHRLMVEYLDEIAPDPMDPLCELLEDMGPPPTLATLVGRSPNDSSLSYLAKNEVCLTLVNKFEVPEEDVTDVNKLFILTKKLLVSILPCLKGETLLEALSSPETEEQEKLYLELVLNYSVKKTNEMQQMYSSYCVSETSLRSCKTLLRRYLAKLELEGLVSQENHYQTIISAIAHDICNHGKYREIIRKELLKLRTTKQGLDEKIKFYEEQVNLYNEYIKTCLRNLNAGKRNVHSLKNAGRRHKVKSKVVLKYSASRLHEKGILIEIDGLPSSQFKNVQFEITPSDVNGIFTICGRFMGVDLEKVDVDIQHLLQLQFDGESVTDIFGKAKVNVNLLLHLLNKKFYGKT